MLTRALVPQFMPLLAAFSLFVFVAIAFAMFWPVGSLARSKFSFVIETLPPVLNDEPNARFYEPVSSSCSKFPGCAFFVWAFGPVLAKEWLPGWPEDVWLWPPAPT